MVRRSAIASHGFLRAIRLDRDAVPEYDADEPEAALSPQRQLSLLSIIHDLVEVRDSQFVIATHSPILMAYPNAVIYQLGLNGITRVAYEDTEHYTITRDFLASPERYFNTLFARRPEREERDEQDE